MQQLVPLYGDNTVSWDQAMAKLDELTLGCNYVSMRA